MKNKRKAERKKYTAQFYQKNHTTFIIALLSTLLTAALNLWIAWVLQQMIDAVSGVPGSLKLSVLADIIFFLAISISSNKNIVPLLSKLSDLFIFSIGFCKFNILLPTGAT